MAIQKRAVPRREVTDSNGTIYADVRGLAFHDLNQLVSLHYDNLDKLLTVWEHYQEVSERKDPGAMMTDADFAAFLADICASAPAIMADVIAMAADELGEDGNPDLASLEEIRRWPMHIQCRALGHIYALSADDFGGPVKLIGALIQQVRMAAPKLGMLPA